MLPPNLLDMADRWWESRASGPCRFTIANGMRPCSRDAIQAFGGLAVCPQHFEMLRVAVLRQLASEVKHGADGYVLQDVTRLVHEVYQRNLTASAARDAAVKRSQIYFAEREGYVKIGRTANLAKRLKDLARGGVIFPPGVSVGPVTVLATHGGGEVAERRLHEQFAIDRVGGEWFRKSESLAAHIASVLSKQAQRGNHGSTASSTYPSRTRCR